MSKVKVRALRTVIVGVGLLAWCLAVLLGCSAGGTSGTGLSYSGGGGRPSTGVSYFTLQGVLRRSGGEGVSGVMVTVATSRMSETDLTDRDGNFSVDVIVGEEEGISFLFRSRTLHWKYLLRHPPQGVDQVTIEFSVDAKGRVLFSGMRY